MRPIWKASSILAALALLVVVMGLSTSNVVQAQVPGPTTASTTDGAPSESFICSNSQAGCTLYDRSGTAAADAADPTNGAPVPTTGSVSVGDNLFLISAATADHTVQVHNLDLPRVTQKVRLVAGTDPITATNAVDGPDANPKTIHVAGGTNVIIEAVHKSSGLVDARCDIDANSSPATTYDPGDCGGTLAAGGATAYQVKAFNGQPDPGELHA